MNQPHVSEQPIVWHDADNLLFKVNRRSFTDPAIMQAEYDRIFDKCWLYIGHESELQKVGDFVTRIIAKRNILFTRELARRVEGTGIVAHAVHPGAVATSFGGDGDGAITAGELESFLQMRVSRRIMQVRPEFRQTPQVAAA